MLTRTEDRFCPYAAVIENPNERLFHCEREGCKKTSCRKCHEVSSARFRFNDLGH